MEKDDKVVELRRFKPRQPVQVFTCDCGGQQYFLLVTGKVQCASCQDIHQDTRWTHPEAQP